MKIQSQSETEKIRKQISDWERGRIFFTEDFLNIRSQESVRLALMTLANEGFILRLARGIYCYPRISQDYAGTRISPQPETIAEALAAREKVRILPYGDQAAYELGLTSLRISDLKYLTDGAPRKISLTNGRKIYFNHTSEVKMFGYRCPTMQLICSAIRTLGKEAIDSEAKRKIAYRLRDVSEKEFMADITIPPAWVKEIIMDIWEN